MSPSAFRVWSVSGRTFCVIIVSMEIFTMQNLDLEGKKLFNIYLHLLLIVICNSQVNCLSFVDIPATETTINRNHRGNLLVIYNF